MIVVLVPEMATESSVDPLQEHEADCYQPSENRALNSVYEYCGLSR